MAEKHPPGYQALRKGRISHENARYFVTTCTHKRKPILCNGHVPQLLFDHLHGEEKVISLIASVVMPDHLHAIIKLNLGELSQAIGMFKSKSAISVNRTLGRSGQMWQEGFFDHKFRDDEDLAPILTYMWKNPEIPGRHFRCRQEEWLWFKSMVTEDPDYPQWLSENPMG